MAQPPAQTRSTPTLLSLPRELRDLIYDSLLQTQEAFRLTIRKHHDPQGTGESTFLMSYTLPGTAETRRAQSSPRGLIWLLTNKQICEEGIEQFQRDATWTLVNDFAVSHAERVMRHISSGHRDHLERFKHPLIMPNTARNMVLELTLHVHPYMELDSRSKHVWKFNIDRWDVISCLLSRDMCSTNLQKVSITLDPSRIRSELDLTHSRSTIRADFFRLPPLGVPSLRIIEFRIQYRCGDYHRVTRHSLEKLKTIFRKALHKLSMELTGGEGFLQQNIDVEDFVGTRNTMYTFRKK